MFLILTRSFPPDVGGMQMLMGGLSESLVNHGPVKVFTYNFPSSNIYDAKSSMNIERVGGIKLFRKYRKANAVNNFLNNNTKKYYPNLNQQRYDQPADLKQPCPCAKYKE